MGPAVVGVENWHARSPRPRRSSLQARGRRVITHYPGSEAIVTGTCSWEASCPLSRSAAFRRDVPFSLTVSRISAASNYPFFWLA